MENAVGLGFVFFAAVAVFIGVHKEEIADGRIDEVIASYIEDEQS